VTGGQPTNFPRLRERENGPNHNGLSLRDEVRGRSKGCRGESAATHSRICNAISVGGTWGSLEDLITLGGGIEDEVI